MAVTFTFGDRLVVPFFTAPERLPPDTDYFTIHAKDLFRATSGTSLLMNPGQPEEMEFSADEVARLLDGTIFQPRDRFIVQKTAHVTICAPKD